MFKGWSKELPDGVEICPVQLPGRESRWSEPANRSFVFLISTLSVALRPLLDVPFALFGHSMGALIGFELARELRREGVSGPRHLFVSGARAPQIDPPEPPIHDLPNPDFVQRLLRFEGIPEEILRNRELIEVLLPVIRADLALCESYVYDLEEPLDCGISAYGGQRDQMVLPGHIAAWRAQTRSLFASRIFSGGHFFLQTARPHLLREVAAELTRILSRISTGCAAKGEP